MRDAPCSRPSPRAIVDPVQGSRAAVGRGADMGRAGLLENALQDGARVDAMEGTKPGNDPLCLIPMWQPAQAALLERHDHIDRRAETERKLTRRHTEREAHVAKKRAEALVKAGCPLRHPQDLHGCRLDA